MLVTKQPVLRRFWYPVLPFDHLQAKHPQPFELLGEAIVLWLDQTGKPVAVRDRCCHRTAKLSPGIVIDGCLRCPYHGWTYNGQGNCGKVPQLSPAQPIPSSYRVSSYRCAIRYGYIWVCLEDPLAPIPELPEADDPKMRFIPEFYERWDCSGLRLMENSFDNAHFSFVHGATFGNQQQPEPAMSEIISTDYGFSLISQVPVVNPPLQQKNLQLATETTVRNVQATWYLPFVRSLKITYPNGLIHLIFTAATPISDRTSQIVQFCLRSDTEQDAKVEDIIAFDRQVTLEDRAILESTDYDAPLDLQAEQHMKSDRPGIIMRQKLAALLKIHGEVEQRRTS